MVGEAVLRGEGINVPLIGQSCDKAEAECGLCPQSAPVPADEFLVGKLESGMV